MLNNNERKLIKECGQEYLIDLVLDSKTIKEQTSFLEHIKLCSFIKKLEYEDIVKLTITEDVRDFEGKFKKFLKYSFAAIAGASFFGLAPPISMFALYIYRKLNDACEKKCYTNIPFSTKRKICKYQCQLDIARKVTDDLRSDIGKCDEFRNPDKCEKKLRKEYMKWAQRVQQLQVKLRQSNLAAQKENRPEFKGFQRRAENMIRTLNLNSFQVIKFIVESKELRESISFRNHLLLYEQFNDLKKKDIEVIVEPPKIDPKKERLIKKLVSLGMLAVPIPLASAAMYYIMKQINFTCLTRCVAQKKYPKNLCYAQCDWLSASEVVKKLEQQYSKCNKLKINKFKCKDKVLKLLEDWKQREVKAKIKFDSELRIAYAKLETKKRDEARRND